MKKNLLKMSLKARVLAAVESLGTATPSQVACMAAKHVTAAQAMRAWERMMVSYRKAHPLKGMKPQVPANPQRSGRNILIREALIRLTNEGKIRRIKRGVYAPLREKAVSA